MKNKERRLFVIAMITLELDKIKETLQAMPDNNLQAFLIELLQLHRKYMLLAGKMEE